MRAVALHRFGGNAPTEDVTFESIDVEGFQSRERDLAKSRWLDINTDSPGPMKRTVLRNVTVRDVGPNPSRVEGFSPEAAIKGLARCVPIDRADVFCWSAGRMKNQPGKPAVGSPGEVDAFMAELKHPLKAEIELARQAILGVNLAIAEGIKWNSPSFRTTEFFATTHLRSGKELQFVFHLGAKVRKAPPIIILTDPKGLVKWLAKDRCLVTVGPAEAFAKNRAAFTAIVREWIKHV